MPEAGWSARPAGLYARDWRPGDPLMNTTQSLVIASVLLAAGSIPASADDSELDQLKEKMKALEQTIEQLKQKMADLEKQKGGAPAVTATTNLPVPPSAFGRKPASVPAETTTNAAATAR